MKNCERHKKTLWNYKHFGYSAVGDDGHECRYVITYQIVYLKCVTDCQL